MDPTGHPPHNPRFGSIPPNPRGVVGAAAGHRRAYSETFLPLPDDLLFDSDPDFGISDIEFPSLSDDSLSAGGGPPPVDSGRSDPPAVEQGRVGRPAGGNHLRSLSVDAAFFEGLALQGPPPSSSGGGVQDRRGLHRRSGSMDGATSLFERDSAPASSDHAKKAVATDKLADLALIDPKRAKRILANRQSAARSKERKIRYTSELERKVQTLQTEATTLSAQLTLLQRDTTGLTTENRELKLRLQAMEQQAHLRDALNEALREEVQRLKIATGQLPNINGNRFNWGLQQNVPPYHQSGHQAQHRRSSSQSSSNGQSMSSPSLNDQMDFM
ncbi:transcription factor VIP1 [Phoenix dactylifera]|uniref:Transcription factor VIP1 n=1 Tax=Phoenix dactylifera TaxID=42345 RepID=A0A8B7BM67_PHODC|nr:transcription factor VIP1 [Phoenix dactylifera]